MAGNYIGYSFIWYGFQLVYQTEQYQPRAISTRFFQIAPFFRIAPFFKIAKKLILHGMKRQGTTSVVPKTGLISTGL
jgi:hypothetical protein